MTRSRPAGNSVSLCQTITGGRPVMASQSGSRVAVTIGSREDNNGGSHRLFRKNVDAVALYHRIGEELFTHGGNVCFGQVSIIMT